MIVENRMTVEREAVLQLRYASYSVKRPHILNPVKTMPDVVDLQVIYVSDGDQ
ncbi:MAG: hypothetical protein LBD44_01340 [Spirochaetaceae bacterium]|jgi:hypothetical protein|nr:hypothetical protein [Spirochaetaceae bacterium]